MKQIAAAVWAPFKKLSLVLLAATLTARGAESQSAASHVNDLRAQLVQRARDYSEALHWDGPVSSVADYIDALRAALRDTVNAAVEASTSGEIALGLREAAVRCTLDVINAYEDHFGTGLGRRTTKWNVFETAELVSIGASLERQLTGMMRSAAAFPDQASTPAALLARIRRARGELDAIATERDLRSGGRRPALQEIREDVTVAEARRTPQIGRIDGKDSEHFSTSFLAELEIRRAASPSDASLRDTIERLVALAPDLAAGASGNRGPPGATSPRTSPAPPRPSSGPSLSDAIAELPSAHLERLEGIRTRTPLQRARADAILALGRALLATSGVQSGAHDPTLSMLSVEDLDRLSRGYSAWLGALELEEAGQPPSARVGAEIKEATQLLDDIKKESRERAAAPNTPESLQRALTNVEDSVTRRALERSRDAILARESAASLQMQDDRGPPVPDLMLRSEIRNATDRWLRQEVELLNDGWARAQALLKNALIAKRGANAAEAGLHVARARESLRARAAAVSHSIEVSCSNEDIPVPLRLRRAWLKDHKERRHRLRRR
jgi:hypothetical protein